VEKGAAARPDQDPHPIYSMTKTTTINFDVIREAAAAMPQAANRTLARALHKQHPKLFPSVESARTSIRYYRGVNGTKHRRMSGAGSVPKPLPIEMPESVAEMRKFFELNDAAEILALPLINAVEAPLMVMPEK